MAGRFALDAEPHVHRRILQQFHRVPLLLRGIVARLRRQVLRRAVGLGHALLERRGGLEEHVREFRPRHPGEQHRRGEDVEAEEHARAAAGRKRLLLVPDWIFLMRFAPSWATTRVSQPSA